MKREYLTLDYLPKLLEFIVEEHLAHKYGDAFYEVKNDHSIVIAPKYLPELDATYTRAADALWASPKTLTKKRGGQHAAEPERLKIALQMIDEHEMKPNAAFQKTALAFPSRGATTESLIQRIRRTYNQKNKRPFMSAIEDVPSMFQLNPSEIDAQLAEIQEADGHKSFVRTHVPDILARIGQKLSVK